MGLTLKKEKFVWEPTRCLVHLGLVVASQTGEFKVDQGSQPTTEIVLAALQSRLAPNTYGTYGSAFRSFLRFAIANHVNPLGATPVDVCHYLAWLAAQGTVKIETCRPYLK